MSIESIVNQSLDLIGYKKHIGSIWDGSVAARVALNAYSETRDEVLAAQPWVFARDLFILDAISGPSSAGVYSFTRPETAITILDVYPYPRVLLEPTPGRWSESYENSARIIVAQHPKVGVVATLRLTNWAIWPPEFTQAVIRMLAEKLSRSLVEPPPKEEK